MEKEKMLVRWKEEEVVDFDEAVTRLELAVECLKCFRERYNYDECSKVCEHIDFCSRLAVSSSEYICKRVGTSIVGLL